MYKSKILLNYSYCICLKTFEMSKIDRNSMSVFFL